ncbi:MAG: endolytic transglycosylase MltG [Hyphomicrobiaceae bacterium]|nr:endolytic transglycosylase MltG [Hyphomicrobiaceae bacterium]
MQNRKKRSDVTRTRTAGARSPNERLEPARAPARPRGLQENEPSRFIGGMVRVASGLFTLALVAMLTLGGMGVVLYNQFERPGPLQEARTIVVAKGKGRIQIAETLEEQGVIANRWTFVAGHLFQTLFGGKRNLDLKAGEYQVEAHASMREVLDTLAQGKSIQYKVAVPEGLTSQQIVERLRAESNLSGEITRVPPEGSLMPDTYLISKGMGRQELLDRMQAHMSEFLETAWAKRQSELPLRTVEEAVVFASIVEKETGRADERSKVAAVFHNRLKKGMRLQSDPTIIYGIVGGQGSLGRAITKPDIDTKTPYNTYQINGLPPGPICNPGRDAIMAALNPEATNDLYFVADGTGGHVFSETLKEHNSAVQKWREVERQTAKTRAANSASQSPDPDAAPVPEDTADDAKTNKTDSRQKAASASADIPLPVRKPKKQ